MFALSVQKKVNKNILGILQTFVTKAIFWIQLLVQKGFNNFIRCEKYDRMMTIVFRPLRTTGHLTNNIQYEQRAKNNKK